MWGNISTEASYQLNFNTSFSTTRSDVLIHLAQWQYWWWFWFAFLWSFYYLLSSRVVRFRALKMRPKINTSYRPHGKWGDFLACIVPIIWCMNILTNSNFILRLIEWQNESSLFTVRVRARQWYWVYKFLLKNIVDILITPRNVGNNKWLLNVFGDLSISDNYLHILNLRAQNKWIKGYWETVINNFPKASQQHLSSMQEFYKIKNINVNNSDLNVNNINILNKNIDINIKNLNFSNLSNFIYNKSYSNNIFKKEYFFDLDNSSFLLLENDNLKVSNKTFFNLNYLKNFLVFNKIKNFIFNNNSNLDNTINMYSDFSRPTRNIKKSFGLHVPFRLIKNTFQNIKLDYHNLFTFRFGKGKNSLFDKPTLNAVYLTVKQKRYEGKKIIPAITKVLKDDNTLQKVRYSNKPILINNTYFASEMKDPTIAYNLIKKNKYRSDLIPVSLAKRIIRVKRTLVLPAHVNVTLISNSFDIVHSWFIPGLGVKIDCVPGRSTHHSFYIDCVGFYFGQCAEICGRYHHHMPIRVCALPFEHFLVWWHTFGLPKLLFTTNQKRFEVNYSLRKFVW